MLSLRTRTRVVALGTVALVALAVNPSARADHDHPVIPSKSQVEDAQRNADTAQSSVSAIQGELATANQQLEDLAVAAEQAAEAYNGALLAWHRAQHRAVVTAHRADRAARQADQARGQLAGYLVTSDNAGTDLTSFGTALTADGPHTLLTHMAEQDTSERTLDGHLQQWQASSELAEVYRADAKTALTAAAAAKLKADVARQAAQDAVSVQQDAVVTIGARRDTLMRELAAAQEISVSLATQRQTGLEERRQARLREQRHQEMLRQQRLEDLRQERADRRERRQERRDHHQTPPPSSPDPDPAPDPSPSPSPPPAPPAPPTHSGGAQAAIDFAYAQLGEPYVWGAAGPDSWDCSGLTMGSWAAAGVYLPHYSVAQYYATTPLSYGELQPGDLIFWASNSSDPNSIFHVALYIGGGQMIQAPRTGRNVEVQDVWYWESPDFFGRP